jgi:alpha-methylacyl-CoA racemase
MGGGRQCPSRAGYRVLDLVAGPGPYCALILAQLGADVIVVDDGSPRGRAAREGGSLALYGAGRELRASRVPADRARPQASGRAGGRPAVDRAGRCVARRVPTGRRRAPWAGRRGAHDGPSRLVYCSISGYGQDGPYRDKAGHDVNYLSLAGLLGLTGAAGGPPPCRERSSRTSPRAGCPRSSRHWRPWFDRERTDAAGSSTWRCRRGRGVAGAGAGTAGDGRADGARRDDPERRGPWHSVYATADGRYVSVRAIEPWLFAHLCERLDHPEWAEKQFERSAWPGLRADLAGTFGARPLDGWRPLFDDADACVSPVATIDEALGDPQLSQRATFAFGPEGAVHPRVVPRVSGVGAASPVRAWWPEAGADADEVLSDLGSASTNDRRCGLTERFTSRRHYDRTVGVRPSIPAAWEEKRYNRIAPTHASARRQSGVDSRASGGSPGCARAPDARSKQAARCR